MLTFWKRNHCGFVFNSNGKMFSSMHELKIYVGESVMYGNDRFSNCLLIPSRPDDI